MPPNPLKKILKPKAWFQKKKFVQIYIIKEEIPGYIQ
jgi:hypothetical protein